MATRAMSRVTLYYPLAISKIGANQLQCIEWKGFTSIHQAEFHVRKHLAELYGKRGYKSVPELVVKRFTEGEMLFYEKKTGKKVGQVKANVPYEKV